MADEVGRSIEELEREHSERMNKEAIERIKKETLTQEQAERIESVFFEDDAEVRLRDGKRYRIPPCTLKNARKLMMLLKTVNVDVIMLNFIPTGNGEQDERKIDELYQILEMAFVNYKDIDRDFIEEYVDVEVAKKIIEILIGLNGLKK